MLYAAVTIPSRSLVARLMAPVALMALLVVALGLVTIGTRSRLHRAFDALTLSQEVRTDLIEVRSLSRSLQRDALNLLLETDRRELNVLHGKFKDRSATMRLRLDDLVTHATGVDLPERAPYLRSQKIVLDRLAAVAALAQRGERERAHTTFRLQVRPYERAASAIADRMIDDQDVKVVRLRTQAQAVERQEIIVGGLASVLLFLCAAAGTLLIIRRSVLRPLADIENAMTLIAGGDTAGSTPHVARQDEIGRMARAIEVFRGSVLDRERLRVVQERREHQDVQQELLREKARRREEEAAAARNVAIARSALALQTGVGEVLQSLRHSSVQLSAASRELIDHSAAAHRGMHEVGAAVGRAVNGSTDIATATDQFMTAIGQASRNTRRSADLGASAAGETAVLAGRMERVKQAAEEIGAVVSLIAGIAKQTNLLALNATIEAARAGAVGKGFAVVAGEVKQLAGQTARATDQIAGQIAAMQQATHDAGEGLTMIDGMISEIALSTETLAESIAEQNESGQIINRNITGAAADLDLIAGRVTEVSAAAGGVDALASRVQADAGLLERNAVAIDRALSAFFAELDAVEHVGDR